MLRRDWRRKPPGLDFGGRQWSSNCFCRVVKAKPETTYDNFTPDFGERFVPGTTRGPTPDIALATVVRRRGSSRLGWPVHAGGEAGVDLLGIERRDGFGCGKGYGRAVLVADPRHAVG
jgi:hypothetical protein